MTQHTRSNPPQLVRVHQLPQQGGAHYSLNKWALADESTEQRHDDPQGTINNDNNNSTAMFDESHDTHTHTSQFWIETHDTHITVLD